VGARGTGPIHQGIAAALTDVVLLTPIVVLVPDWVLAEVKLGIAAVPAADLDGLIAEHADDGWTREMVVAGQMFAIALKAAIG
jgi:hypothetical protein